MVLIETQTDTHIYTQRHIHPQYSCTYGAYTLKHLYTHTYTNPFLHTDTFIDEYTHSYEHTGTHIIIITLPPPTSFCFHTVRNALIPL